MPYQIRRHFRALQYGECEYRAHKHIKVDEVQDNGSPAEQRRMSGLFDKLFWNYKIPIQHATHLKLTR